MALMKFALALLAMAALAVAKPSHPFALHSAIPEHFDFAPPVLPPTHFHAAAPVPEPWLPAPHLHAAAPAPLLPAPAQYLPAPAQLLPAPAPILPAPAPIFPAPAPAPIFPAPAPFFPAPAPAAILPAPLLPAPVVHHHHHVLPAPLPVPVPVLSAPVLEPAPFVAPTYRAIPGPKTTTHHVSVGYAFPHAHVAKIVAPHAHLHAAHLHSAPLLSHHHHHSLF
ncbi:uncharacterized protein LOC128861146 [Anastrepha ludens]|uniref:uncharacterized protein LOC128861146 n=1 Tax=Anastrepha ludens TaxID=28586 RepID=UPI0023B0399F|nr:uncharacterized protein LOC128861146 [Anastrepha ludens]